MILTAQNSFHLPSYRNNDTNNKQNQTFNVLEKNVKEKAVHYHQLMSHYFCRGFPNLCRLTDLNWFFCKSEDKSRES